MEFSPELTLDCNFGLSKIFLFDDASSGNDITSGGSRQIIILTAGPYDKMFEKHCYPPRFFLDQEVCRVSKRPTGFFSLQ